MQDARRLTRKYGGSDTTWEDVAYWLLQKAKRNYYTDPVVKYGYCRGLEPVTYVDHILELRTLPGIRDDHLILAAGTDTENAIILRCASTYTAPAIKALNAIASSIPLTKRRRTQKVGAESVFRSRK